MANKDINIAIKAKNETASGFQSAIGSLKSLDNQVSAVTKTFHALGKLTVIAGIGAAIKKAGEAALDAANEFGTAERTLTQLRTAVGGSEDRVTALTTLIDRLAGTTLESKDSLEKIVAELASFGRSDQEIERITRAVTILSNVTGDSLESAFTKLNGTYTGTVGKLEKLDASFGALTKSQLESGGAVDLVIKKYGAISDSMSGGWSQSVKNLKNSFEELSEAIGKDSARALTPLVSAITRIVDAWTEAITAQQRYREIMDKDAELRTNEDQAFLRERELKDVLYKQDRLKEGSQYTVGTAEGLKQKEAALRKELKELYDAIAANKRGLEALKKASAPVSTPVNAPTAPSGDPGFEMYDNGTTDLTNPQDRLLQNILAPPSFSEMYEQGSSDVGSAPEDKLLKNITEAQGAIAELQETAFSFGDAWGSALENISNRFRSWTDVAAEMMTGLVDGVSNGLMDIGAALATGQDGWAAFGSAALSAISEVLKGLGAQLAAMAAVELIKGNLAGAALAAAGAAAAYVTAGAVGAAGRSSSNTNSESGSSQGTYYSSGGYTGPESVTINNYLNGTFYSEADLEKRLYQVSWDAIHNKQLGLATTY